MRGGVAALNRPLSSTTFLFEDTMKSLLVRFVREDHGQDLVEYALLITFIALACIVGMQQLGTAINNNYQSISTSLANAS
jgi:pilus assembly protein Flp/PilA